MRVYFLTLVVVFLSFSCSSFKGELIKYGSKQEAVKNAILDFSNTTTLYKKDSVFSIRVYDPLYKMVLINTDNGNGKWIESEPYENIIAISIVSNYNKMLLTDDNRVGEKGGKLPTRYVERDGKLFYWWDDNYPLTDEILSVLKKHDLLAENNLDGIIGYYDFETSDLEKGVDYYFCKNNLTNYEKVITNKGIGFYDIPEFECNVSK